MKTRISNLWEAVHTSYWFLPTLMVGGALALAVGMLYLDGVYDLDVGYLYQGGSDGARELLSTIAASVITIAGVTFSITIVALSLASSQFGPRLLRHYMRSTGNQFVLGTFVSTFIYSLMVLRVIKEDGYIPSMSVTTAMVLSLASIYVFIYFIHHTAESIQVNTIAHAAFHELMQGIDKMYPDQLGAGMDRDQQTQEHAEPEDFDERAYLITVRKSGYLQAVESEGVMETASEKNLILRFHYRPGDFMVAGSPLVWVYSKEGIDEKLEHKIAGLFITGMRRTPEQDVRFLLQELVEIALRALSPSLNDPFTAITCIDRIEAAICKLAGRRLGSRYRYDEHQRLRVITHVPTFEEFVGSAFDQIYHDSRDNRTVRMRLMKSLTVITGHTNNQQQKEALRRHLDFTAEEAKGTIQDIT